MATPSKTPQPEAGVVQVRIFIDTTTNAIGVHPDPFTVSKGKQEKVQWICDLNHKHDHQKGCFRAHFDKDCPFDQTLFRFHEELSGPPNHASVINKEYKYTVAIEGYKALDPIGIVKP